MPEISKTEVIITQQHLLNDEWINGDRWSKEYNSIEDVLNAYPSAMRRALENPVTVGLVTSYTVLVYNDSINRQCFEVYTTEKPEGD